LFTERKKETFLPFQNKPKNSQTILSNKKNAKNNFGREQKQLAATSLRRTDGISSKALRNWKIFLKALSKRFRKLTIKTKRLWRLK